MWTRGTTGTEDRSSAAQQSPQPEPSAAAAAGTGPEAGRGHPWRDRLRHLPLDAAVLFGLAGVAITQPLLELFGRNPTFFVAGHYEPGQIVAFALVVAVVPGAAVLAVSGPVRFAGRQAGAVAHGVAVGLFAALFALVLCRSIRLDGVVYVVPAVLVAAAAVALAEWRWRQARQFLALLAVGNLVFVVQFLVASPTADLLSADGVAARSDVVVPPHDGPVLLVVLDEFPLTAIVRADGTLNDTRYPNLARLAGTSTWFRNAASESAETPISVPSILTGLRADGSQLPVSDEHPRNLFSLFGPRYPVNRYELVTDMCPDEVCEPPPPQPFSRMLDDASIVYRHRVLPPDLRGGLPPVDTGWGDFGDAVDTAGVDGSGDGDDPTPAATTTTTRPGPWAKLGEKSGDERGNGRLDVLRRQIELVDDQPSVNFVHALVPHHPYTFTPWGEAHLSITWFPDDFARDPSAATLPPVDDPAYDFLFRQVYAMQAMQIGAVDREIGAMIDHLEATGAWDDALVVVTSDHGIDMTAPGFGRRNATNIDELYRIPLFIKAPGQTAGVVDDAPASTVDILPSIVDLLGIEVDWDFDGHSLFDGSTPTIDRHVQTPVETAFEIAAAHEAQFPRGEDWVSLAAVGQGEDLVGTRVADHPAGSQSDLTWRFETPADLDDLSLADDDVPYVLRGEVSGSAERPPELVVAVNGTLAGTIGGYLRGDDGAWTFTAHLAPVFDDGVNRLVGYQVERTDGGITLHPLLS